MICAVITIVRTMTGKAIPGKNAERGALAEAVTIPGTQPSQILKTKINTVAVTNSGIVMAKIAIVDSARSENLSRRRPVRTPRNRASGMPSASEQPARSNVFFSRSPTSEAIGLLLCAEMPRSPRTAPEAHST